MSTGARNIFAHCLTNTSDVIANDERSINLDTEAVERVEAELEIVHEGEIVGFAQNEAGLPTYQHYDPDSIETD